ncbi:hypothetical protein B0H19DRAFT_1152955, partial [Mycena capillaripes]
MGQGAGAARGYTHRMWAYGGVACGSGTGDGRKNSAGRAQKQRRSSAKAAAHCALGCRVFVLLEGEQHSAAVAVVRGCCKIGSGSWCENSGAGARSCSHSQWAAQRGDVSERYAVAVGWLKRKRARKIGGSGRCENNASRSHSSGA